MSAEKRIVRNLIRCKRCNTFAESTHRHHQARCECGAVFADGGTDYLRRGWMGGEPGEAYVELSEYAGDER